MGWKFQYVNVVVDVVSIFFLSEGARIVLFSIVMSFSMIQESCIHQPLVCSVKYTEILAPYSTGLYVAERLLVCLCTWRNTGKGLKACAELKDLLNLYSRI